LKEMMIRNNGLTEHDDFDRNDSYK